MKEEAENETIQRLLRQQAALAAFGSYAYHETDLLKILTEAARLCAEGLGVRHCKVLKYRPAENDLLVEAGVGWKKDIVGQAIAQADRSSPEGRAFVTRQPVITIHLEATADFRLPPIYAEHGIVASVNVLIQGNDQPYGVLEADSDVQRDFDEYDINFLTGYANVLAEALAGARRTEALHASIEERDLLARELQHRVRNNLQLVYQLLLNQVGATAPDEAKRRMERVAQRVLTLGQVYDHLMGVGLSRMIDFGAYLRALCSSVSEFHRQDHHDIEVICNIDSLHIDLDRSTALGIITNELLSNSYEHAFPTQRGRINVILRHQGEEQATLIISDNGTGFEENKDSKRLGLSIVRRLVQQVRGTLELHRDSGTRWVIRLPINKPDPPEPSSRKL